MNENPGGTPNPLNPTPLDANPSEPMGDAPVHEEPVHEEPVHEEPVQEVNTVPEPASQPLTEELVEESVHVSSLDPEGRPMEKAGTVAQAPAPKKKKTGLIVGLVICLFIAVGCGVAAILMLMNSGKDPVSAAVSKLMSGDVPANVGVSGQIEVLINDSDSEIAKATINLDSQLKTGSMINTTNADVTLTSVEESEFSFKLSEVYAEGGNVYLKVDKKEEEVLEDEELPEETNCIEDESGMTNCGLEEEESEEETVYSDDLVGTLSGIISMIDGQWVELDLATSGWITGSITPNSEMTCVINAINNMNTNSNSLAEYYNKNAFIGSTTENISLNSRYSQLRRITLDEKKFVGFINSIQSSPAAAAVNECLGAEDSVEFTTEDAIEMISKMPAVYVEVNPDNSFARLYTKIASDDGNTTVTIDLSFTYPVSINVSAPTEYVELDELIKNVMGYDFEDEEIVIEEDLVVEDEEIEPTTEE